MKTKKLNILVVFVLLGFLLVFMTGCNNVSRKSYLGTWIYHGFGTGITFSSENFTFHGMDGEFTVASPTWTRVVNTNEETKKDYPSGYKIFGEVTEHHGGGVFFTGDIVGEEWAFFMHKNKHDMIEQCINNTWYYELSRDLSQTDSQEDIQEDTQDDLQEDVQD